MSTHGNRLWLVLSMILTLALFLLAGCGAAATSSLSQSSAAPVVKATKSATASTTLADGDLQITILNVGQADAALIQYKGKNMLIDTGDVEHRTALVQQLRDRNVKEIDAIIISHPHGDHIGGMAALFNNFKINRIYDNGVTANTATFRNYLKSIKSKDIPRQILRKGDQVTLGDDVTFDILAPSEPLFTKENAHKMSSGGIMNNNSIVCKLKYHDFSMLFVGDAQKESEKRMLGDESAQLKSDILKVGHHGSKTASSLAFIKAVSPKAATISCGAGNEYKFPHKQPLDALRQVSADVYRTDTDGIITIISDGTSYKITKEH